MFARLSKVVAALTLVLAADVVIGKPGFGTVPGPDGPVHFPQTGDVVIGDRVDVGAHTAIDRATFTSLTIPASVTRNGGRRKA